MKGRIILNSLAVINEVISVFLIVLVGVIASKTKIITDSINKGLTEILLKITLPLLVLSSFNLDFSTDMKANILKCFIYSFGVYIITPIISYVFLIPVKGSKKKVLQFANTFSNCAFIGFAVMDSVYGAEGVAYASVFNMFFSLFLWTYGVALFSDKLSLKEAKKVLLNPGIVAVYIGIIMMVFNIKLPAIVFKSVKSVGSMTTPLSMVIVGVMLSKVNIKSLLKDWTLYYGTFIKLIVIPVFIFIVAVILKDESKVMNTMILLQAMPAAATTSIFAENFNKGQEYSAGIVFFTTLFCIVTFPIMLKLVS